MKKALSLLLLLLAGPASAELLDLRMSLTIPSDLASVTGAPTFTNTTIDGQDEKISWVFQYDSTVTVTGLGFTYGATTTGGTLFAELQSVSSRTPTGLQLCAGSSTTINSVAADDAVVRTYSFVSSCLPTYGSTVAIVISRPAGSAYNGTISRTLADLDTSNFGFSITSTSAAGWVAAANIPNIILTQSDGGFFSPNYASFWGVIVSSTVNTSTSTIYGNKWTPGFGGRTDGLKAWIDPDGPCEFQLRLADTGTTVATAYVSSHVVATNTGFSHYLAWDTPVVFTSTMSFFIMARQLTTSSLVLYGNTLTNETMFNNVVNGGASLYRVEVPLANLGTPNAYSHARNSRMMFYPMIDQIEVGGGSQTATSYVGP